MTAHAIRHYGRIVRHFVATRALEVGALQASPFIGIFLGGYRIEHGGVAAPILLLLGSCALTAHIFVFNDWAGYESDLRAPQRSPHVFSRHGISRGEVAGASAALLVLAAVAFAAVGLPALLIGTAIAALGFLYSASPVLGKSTPVAASLNHLAGGTLHFLLGYTLARDPDATGLMIGLFFGLVFAAGHLNQEVRDYDDDRLTGIRTNAVVFGCRPAFVASVVTFTTAYALLTALAAFGILPALLRWSPIAWLLHLAWSAQALARGLRFETAVWMQQRYRWLFALIGLVMLAGQFDASSGIGALPRP
ncbi:MAG TPA: UbiA family prenyltransferase [Tahibacter sp.]|uniref:UbiA family prenyltransferase n=1 Tax=Tahibacter sp. TaxID=2056211 RepID=UPI002BAD2A0B|nr:UbiA family prenyltransferase [Tahibacter sp.]HSX59080.1 UbiA family prenyltransferase [Tahibacter sp.]